MTMNRHARVRELYGLGVMEDILLREAAGEHELSELEKELAEESTTQEPRKPKAPGGPAAPGLTPVEELEKELEAERPPEGELSGEEPVKPERKEKPIVMPSTREPESPQLGFSFAPKKYTPHEARAKVCPVCHYQNRPIFLTECKKCKNLYNRMRRKVDYYDLTPEQAVRALTAESNYGYSVLKTIYNTLGTTPLTTEDIEEVSPSLNKQVEDMLWYRFNVQKDEKTKEPKTDERGIPLSLPKPVYYTSKQLGLGLRLTPELFTQKIDEYNSGKKEKDWVKPAYSADVISDVPGKRYRATYLSIWNWKKIKPVFADWIKELEERIIPEEKIERAKASIARITEALRNSKSQQETVEEELRILARDTPNRKYLRLLNAFRKASAEEAAELKRKYKVTRDMLEKKFGKELDYFIKMLEYKHGALSRITKKREELEKRLEQRKSWLFKLLEQRGYVFKIEEEVADKEKEAEASELEREIMGGEATPTDPAEVDELERELTSRLDVLHGLLRFSAPVGPRQMGLFGDEPEDPDEKLRSLLESETGNVNVFPGPQPPPEFPPEPEPEPEPEFQPVPRPEQVAGPAPGPFRAKKIVDLFGTVKGRYKIRFMSVNPLTKEKKALSGVFQYTPGARSKNVEEALKKRVTEKFKTLLVETHGVGPGSYVRAIVTDPTGKTKAFSFNIDKDGEMLWHGTRIEDRRRKLELLESQPKEKSMWTMGLISLDDLVEVDGKLVEKELLEKGYISPEPHLPPKIRKQKERETQQLVPKPKKIDELRQKKELGTIKEDEITELADLETAERDRTRIKELQEKEELTPEEKAELENLENLYEDVKFDPLSRLKPIGEPAEREPTEFTRTCPYKGCGAKVPEDSKTCWKCKSPIARNEIRKVIMRRIKVTKERTVKDPATGQMIKEEYDTYPPIHSLVTVTTDDKGKPVAARCEKLNVTYQTTGGTRDVPAFPRIMKKIQEAVDKIVKDPKYTPEQKEKAKANMNTIYERKAAEEPDGDTPWRTVKVTKPQAGLPGKACENCPGEIGAPFENACAEIEAALKSLDPDEKLPYGYVVWDYEKVRKIKESPEPVRHPWVTERMPEANDERYASRFDAIMKLYLAD